MSMDTLMPNTSFQGIAEKLRFPMPSGLRPPAALELKRWTPQLNAGVARLAAQGLLGVGQ